ncbi:WD40 repeat domain-containing protein [Candidatus Woesearchaeota archaeon]|nr:MAG: WD40 repeat domain-containing protein [Candidatus Woesearchaeota archaeon]
MKAKQTVIGGLITIIILLNGATLVLQQTTDNPNYDVCRKGRTYGTWKLITPDKPLHLSKFAPALGRYRCSVERTTRWCRKTTRTRCYYLDMKSITRNKLLLDEAKDDRPFIVKSRQYEVLKENRQTFTILNSTVTYSPGNLMQLETTPDGNIKFGFENAGCYLVTNVQRMEGYDAVIGYRNCTDPLTHEETRCPVRIENNMQVKTFNITVCDRNDPRECWTIQEQREVGRLTYNPKTHTLRVCHQDNFDPAVATISSFNNNQRSTAKDSNGNWWIAASDSSSDLRVYKSTDDGQTWTMHKLLHVGTVRSASYTIAPDGTHWIAAAVGNGVEIRVFNSSDDWTTWNEFTIHNVNQYPCGFRPYEGASIAADKNSNIYLAWASDMSLNYTGDGSSDYGNGWVFFHYYNKSTGQWNTPENADCHDLNQTDVRVEWDGSPTQGGNGNRMADVVVTSDNQVFVTWWNLHHDKYLIDKWTGTWADNEIYTYDGVDMGGAGTWVDDQDRIWAAFTEGGKIVVQRQNASTWNSPWTTLSDQEQAFTVVDYENANNRIPIITTNDSRAVVVYQREDASVTDNQNLYYGISTDDGQTWLWDVLLIDLDQSGAATAYFPNPATFGIPSWASNYSGTHLPITFYNGTSTLTFKYIETNGPPTTPSSITCNGGTCNTTITSSPVTMKCQSTDPDGDTITYDLKAAYYSPILNTTTNKTLTTATKDIETTGNPGTIDFSTDYNNPSYATTEDGGTTCSSGTTCYAVGNIDWSSGSLLANYTMTFDYDLSGNNASQIGSMTFKIKFCNTGNAPNNGCANDNAEWEDSPTSSVLWDGQTYPGYGQLSAFVYDWNTGEWVEFAGTDDRINVGDQAGGNYDDQLYTVSWTLDNSVTPSEGWINNTGTMRIKLMEWGEIEANAWEVSLYVDYAFLDVTFGNQRTEETIGNYTGTSGYSWDVTSKNGMTYSELLCRAKDQNGTNTWTSTLTQPTNLTISLTGGGSSCDCPSPASNWQWDYSEGCTISNNCNIDGYNITGTGTGSITCNAQITADNMQPLTTGQQLNIGSSCKITLNGGT